MTPRPPSCASAMARRDSVTVSIAAETIGMLSGCRGTGGAQVDLVGVDLGVAGPDQDVVEGESERQISRGHAISRDRNELDGAADDSAPVAIVHA